MRILLRLGALAVIGAIAACDAPGPTLADSLRLGTGGEAPFEAPGLLRPAGQAVTCAGPSDKVFTLEARETTVDLGMGVRFEAWTYDGTIPGPVLEACEGDRVTIRVSNRASTSHGLDSHALRLDMRRLEGVPSGKTLTIETTVATPGVYMYHCASGPVTDVHIKSGLYGAMIVHPRNRARRPARELVVVQSGVFGARDASGLIPGTDPLRAQKNDPELMMFNGRLGHPAMPVRPGDLVRVYFVNVGPGVAAAHVMGTLLDAVYDGTNTTHDVQTYGVAPGSGAIIEFEIPEHGMYGLVDHDRLSFVGWGMVLTFDATGGKSRAHE